MEIFHNIKSQLKKQIVIKSKRVSNQLNNQTIVMGLGPKRVFSNVFIQNDIFVENEFLIDFRYELCFISC